MVLSLATLNMRHDVFKRAAFGGRVFAFYQPMYLGKAPHLLDAVAYSVRKGVLGYPDWFECLYHVIRGQAGYR
jgi:hypothetical protein